MSATSPSSGVRRIAATSLTLFKFGDPAFKRRDCGPARFAGVSLRI